MLLAIFEQKRLSKFNALIFEFNREQHTDIMSTSDFELAIRGVEHITIFLTEARNLSLRKQNFSDAPPTFRQTSFGWELPRFRNPFQAAECLGAIVEIFMRRSRDAAVIPVELRPHLHRLVQDVARARQNGVWSWTAAEARDVGAMVERARGLR